MNVQKQISNSAVMNYLQQVTQRLIFKQILFFFSCPDVVGSNKNMARQRNSVTMAEDTNRSRTLQTVGLALLHKLPLQQAMASIHAKLVWQPLVTML